MGGIGGKRESIELMLATSWCSGRSKTPGDLTCSRFYRAETAQDVEAFSV